MSLLVIVSIVGIFFSLENVQGGLMSFLHLVNFILCCISQRSRISFPLTSLHFFLSLFSIKPSHPKEIAPIEISKKVLLPKKKKQKKNPLLEIATKEFHPITHSFLGTSLTSVSNQSSTGILHCA